MTMDYQRVTAIKHEKHVEMVCDETTRLDASAAKLLDALFGDVPFDWRYNATHWALNAADLCLEIAHSIEWMRAMADYVQECGPDDRHSAEGLVTYYADNAVTRVTACRDKLALLAWSYYCPFNPDNREEVLTFHKVYERLETPIRFGLQLEGHDDFLRELDKLRGECFQQAKTYRDRKIHRMDPRVMLRAPEESDQPSYKFALTSDKDIRKFDDKLATMYPDDRFRAAVRSSCFLDAVLFETRAPNQLVWHYPDFDQMTHECWKCLCNATAGSCDILLAREPMLSKDKPSGDFE